jgi:xanthine dehydrogenase molybdopterin-binding subunit B
MTEQNIALEYRRKLAELADAQLTEMQISRNGYEQQLKEMDAEHAAAVAGVKRQITALDTLAEEIAATANHHRQVIAEQEVPHTGVMAAVPPVIGDKLVAEVAGRQS